MPFSNKVAVVTGSGGIGLATALHLAAKGATVHLCGNDARHNSDAQSATTDLDVSVHHIDVSQDEQVNDLIDSIVEHSSGIDILVNAAAIQTYGSVESTDMTHWDRVMNVNLRAYFLMSHAVYPQMKVQGGGAIVHLASVQGHANQSDVVAYATAKGAILALTRAMAVDCAKDNIRVNSVSPGSIRTPLLEISAQHFSTDGKTIDQMIDEFGRAHPIGRVGTAAEVAELIAFLVSDKAGFCTGADYVVDGGLLAQIGV